MGGCLTASPGVPFRPSAKTRCGSAGSGTCTPIVLRHARRTRSRPTARFSASGAAKVRRHLALNTRPVLAIGMPERDDFKVLASRTVVDEVAGSRQIQATRFGIAGVFDQGADARLLNQRFECGIQVRAYGSWRCGAVLSPPGSGGVNLPLSPWLDTNEQR